jgi:hypothetical protein
VDEIIGAIVEQVAKNAREAAKRRAAALPAATLAGNARARQAQIARALGGPVPAAAPVSAPAPVPAPSAASATPPAPDPFAGDTVLLGSSAIIGGDSPFGALLAPGEPIPVANSDSLLGAFSGGAPFLGAFIVSEALAPPLALREPRRT